MPEIGTSGSMSGDGKRSAAAWPKLPRPSSTLPNAKASDVRFVAALKIISVRSSDIRGIDAIEPMAVNHVVPVMAKTAQWLP
jgi:hypothetical protein